MDSTAQPAFALLERPEQLDALIEASFSRPVLILKHSPACGTSYQALDDLEEGRQRLASLEVHLVDVLRNRPLSQSIASRFQVRHESPQALLIVDGRVSWSASHYGVTTERISRALANATSGR